MATKKILGLFWDETSIYFAENSDNSASKILQYPLNFGKILSAAAGREATENLKLTELIQRALLENRIDTKILSLSLPTQDIIFRSFVIPWMQSSEMQGAVEFEASKYVPFEVETLAYNYYPITQFKDKKKQILIIFVAIRRDVLESYCNIITHSNLKIELIEPGQISLFRFLYFRKLLPKNKIVAIIDSDLTTGRIMIIEKNTPQFIREFQLARLDPQNPVKDADATQAKLFNEIRISLDFYARQYTTAKIDQVLYLSSNDAHQLCDSLNKYLNIPALNINVAQSLNTPITDIGSLKAFGITLRNTALPSLNFDLTLQKPAEALDETLAEEPSLNYLSIALTALACLSILWGVHQFSQKRTLSYKEKIRVTTEQLGMYESSPLEMIQGQTTEVKNKLTVYQNLRMHSKLSLFLTLLSRLVPDNIWLQDISLNYRDETSSSAISLTLNGFVYLENVGQQVILINRFIDALKADKNFSAYFKTIDLVTANKQELEGHRVTSFTLSCQ